MPRIPDFTPPERLARAEADFRRFAVAQEAQARDAADAIPPGGGGVTTAFRNRYRADAQAMAGAWPPEARLRLSPQIFALEHRLAGPLSQVETTEKLRHHGALQDAEDADLLDTAAWHIDPAQRDAAVEALYGANRSNPDLPPAIRQSRVAGLPDRIALAQGNALLADTRRRQAIWQSTAPATNGGAPGAPSLAGGAGAPVLADGAGGDRLTPLSMRGLPPLADGGHAVATDYFRGLHPSASFPVIEQLAAKAALTRQDDIRRAADTSARLARLIGQDAVSIRDTGRENPDLDLDEVLAHFGPAIAAHVRQGRDQARADHIANALSLATGQPAAAAQALATWGRPAADDPAKASAGHLGGAPPASPTGPAPPGLSPQAEGPAKPATADVSPVARRPSPPAPGPVAPTPPGPPLSVSGSLFPREPADQFLDRQHLVNHINEASPSPSPPPEAPGLLNGLVRAVATGVPIVGGALNRADAATNATLAPVLNGWFSPEDQLQGETWAERYANSLKQQEQKDVGFAAEHPVVNAGANINGAVAGTIPAVMAAPAAFGVSVAPIAGRMLAGALTGAGIGGVDAAVRYPGDVGAVVKGTGFGLAGGAAGPVLGKGIGYLASKFAGGIVARGLKAASKGTMDFVTPRLGGRLYDTVKLKRLRGYLSRRGVTLEVGDGLLPPNAAAAFDVIEGRIIFNKNPTEYEVWHELFHYMQSKNLE